MFDQSHAEFDLAIIGGGINGCGIARDAAGRGARVVLLEQGDLASGTSSASTKLIHGGLRYLEHFEFGLVRAALRERETLWRIAPHLVSPLRFILPHRPGLRPRWLMRTGLWIYDHLGARDLLPPTRSIKLAEHVAGATLQRTFTSGWEYSDCWVDDARLVILNARDAADRGATILPHHRVSGASRSADGWFLTATRGDGSQCRLSARVLINAAGPGVADVLALAGADGAHTISRVRGSHIVVPRLYDHEFAFAFQLSDRRLLFAIPYEHDFTLIGTTERDHSGGMVDVRPTDDEIAYLCRASNQNLRQQISPADVVWSFAGIRALVDSGDAAHRSASRDYRIAVDGVKSAAPLVTVYGGKITTYRLLAEEVADRLAPYCDAMRAANWTATAALPGGDFEVMGRDALAANLSKHYPFLNQRDSSRIASAYGTKALVWLGAARMPSDLGEDFGAGLRGAEVDYCMAHEWACTVDDMLWRRSKLGLRIDSAGRAALGAYMDRKAGR